MRRLDDVVIGYPISTDSDGVTSFDLSDPYLVPTDTKFDLTLSYSKKLKNNINWRIQMNIRNMFAEKDLIPITVQPDGTPAALRIPEARTWTVTNTFDF